MWPCRVLPRAPSPRQFERHCAAAARHRLGTAGRARGKARLALPFLQNDATLANTPSVVIARQRGLSPANATGATLQTHLPPQDVATRLFLLDKRSY
jgi:hypothetical protein